MTDQPHLIPLPPVDERTLQPRAREALAVLRANPPGLTALQLGHEGGKPLRVEVTRLPRPRTIEWDGRRVGTVASQFVAYLDGRIQEVAVDYFAQADDGSVWYFGEDVANYEDGVVVDHEGTVIARLGELPVRHTRLLR